MIPTVVVRDAGMLVDDVGGRLDAGFFDPRCNERADVTERARIENRADLPNHPARLGLELTQTLQHLRFTDPKLLCKRSKRPQHERHFTLDCIQQFQIYIFQGRGHGSVL